MDHGKVKNYKEDDNTGDDNHCGDAWEKRKTITETTSRVEIEGDDDGALTNVEK